MPASDYPTFIGFYENPDKASHIQIRVFKIKYANYPRLEFEIVESSTRKGEVRTKNRRTTFCISYETGEALSKMIAVLSSNKDPQAPYPVVPDEIGELN